MPKVDVAIPDQMLEFVDGLVAAGRYADRSAVAEAALSMMREDDARLERLRDAIQVGLDDFDAGLYVEVEDVEAWIKTLGREAA
jgi:antitoxin ParD1/3/4